MKKLGKKYFAICILLTCVICGGCGLKGDLKAITHKKNTIDSLHVEFERLHVEFEIADSLADYYGRMQGLSGGVLGDADMWWAYRDSANRSIDKMIEYCDKMIVVNNERMRVRDSR